MASWAARVAALRNSPAGTRFEELEAILRRIGYRTDRQCGSHRILACRGLPSLNLPPARNGLAKSYQLRQVLALIDEFQIEVK